MMQFSLAENLGLTFNLTCIDIDDSSINSHTKFHNAYSYLIAFEGRGMLSLACPFNILIYLFLSGHHLSWTLLLHFHHAY